MYYLCIVFHLITEHVKPAFLEEVETGRLRVMPNSFLPAAPLEKPGVMVLGDALNMRHPLTGGGMSVVFNDVLLCRDIFKKLPDTKDYAAILNAMRSFNRDRKQHHSFVVNILAQALYQLFSATSKDGKCFHRSGASLTVCSCVSFTP